MSRGSALVLLCSALFASAAPAQGRSVRLGLGAGFQSIRLSPHQGEVSGLPQSVGQGAFTLDAGLGAGAPLDLDAFYRRGAWGGLRYSAWGGGLRYHPGSRGGISLRAAAGRTTATLHPECAAQEDCDPVRAAGAALELGIGYDFRLRQGELLGPVLWFGQSLGGGVRSRSIGIGVRLANR